MFTPHPIPKMGWTRDKIENHTGIVNFFLEKNLVPLPFLLLLEGVGPPGAGNSSILY